MKNQRLKLNAKNIKYSNKKELIVWWQELLPLINYTCEGKWHDLNSTENS